MNVTEWEAAYDNVGSYFGNTMLIGLWIVLGVLAVLVLIVIIYLIKGAVNIHTYNKDYRKWEEECAKIDDRIDFIANEYTDNDLKDVPVAVALNVVNYRQAKEKYESLYNSDHPDFKELSEAKEEMDSWFEDVKNAHLQEECYPAKPLKGQYNAYVSDDINDASYGMLKFLGVITLITAGICFIVGMCRMSARTSELTKMNIQEEYVQDIYCMDMQNEVSGTGNRYYIKISTDSYYYYYVKDTTGNYVLSKVKVEGTSLSETSTRTPSLYKYKPEGESKVKYILYVPEGTILSAGYSPF